MWTCCPVRKPKFYGAFVLNRRVLLHAIDATPARWRGDAGSSPLAHATHWLISTQVAIMGPASALRFVRLARSKHSIERVSPLSVIGLALLACYCFGVLVWTGSLLVDQGGLISRNETSIERVKKTWRGRRNPHDRGAFRNWLEFFFRAMPSVVLDLDQVESRCEAA